MRVPCARFEVQCPSRGAWVDGVAVVCRRCANASSAMGRGPKSTVVALIRLRETCPKKERNRYDEESPTDRDHPFVGPDPTPAAEEVEWIEP